MPMDKTMKESIENFSKNLGNKDARRTELATQMHAAVQAGLELCVELTRPVDMGGTHETLTPKEQRFVDVMTRFGTLMMLDTIVSDFEAVLHNVPGGATTAAAMKDPNLK